MAELIGINTPVLPTQQIENVDFTPMLMQVGNELNRRYYENKQQYLTNLIDPLSKIETNDRTKDLVNEVRNNITKKFEKYTDGDDWHKAENDIFETSREILNHDGLKKAIQDESNYQAFKKQLSESDWSQDSQNAILKEALLSSSKLVYNEKDNTTTGGFVPVSIGKPFDIEKYQNDIATKISQMKADEEFKSGLLSDIEAVEKYGLDYLINPDESITASKIVKLIQNIEYRSPEKIKNVAEQLMMSSQDYQNALRIKFRHQFVNNHYDAETNTLKDIDAKELFPYLNTDVIALNQLINESLEDFSVLDLVKFDNKNNKYIVKNNKELTESQLEWLDFFKSRKGFTVADVLNGTKSLEDNLIERLVRKNIEESYVNINEQEPISEDDWLYSKLQSAYIKSHMNEFSTALSNLYSSKKITTDFNLYDNPNYTERVKQMLDLEKERAKQEVLDSSYNITSLNSVSYANDDLGIHNINDLHNKNTQLTNENNSIVDQLRTNIDYQEILKMVDINISDNNFKDKLNNIDLYNIRLKLYGDPKNENDSGLVGKTINTSYQGDWNNFSSVSRNSKHEYHTPLYTEYTVTKDAIDKTYALLSKYNANLRQININKSNIQTESLTLKSLTEDILKHPDEYISTMWGPLGAMGDQINDTNAVMIMTAGLHDYDSYYKFAKALANEYDKLGEWGKFSTTSLIANHPFGNAYDGIYAPPISGVDAGNFNILSKEEYEELHSDVVTQALSIYNSLHGKPIQAVTTNMVSLNPHWKTKEMIQKWTDQGKISGGGWYIVGGSETGAENIAGEDLADIFGLNVLSQKVTVNDKGTTITTSNTLPDGSNGIDGEPFGIPGKIFSTESYLLLDPTLAANGKVGMIISCKDRNGALLGNIRVAKNMNPDTISQIYMYEYIAAKHAFDMGDPDGANDIDNVLSVVTNSMYKFKKQNDYPYASNIADLQSKIDQSPNQSVTVKVEIPNLILPDENMERELTFKKIGGRYYVEDTDPIAQRTNNKGRFFYTVEVGSGNSTQIQEINPTIIPEFQNISYQTGYTSLTEALRGLTLWNVDTCSYFFNQQNQMKQMMYYGR